MVGPGLMFVVGGGRRGGVFCRSEVLSPYFIQLPAFYDSVRSRRIAFINLASIGVKDPLHTEH